MAAVMSSRRVHLGGTGVSSSNFHALLPGSAFEAPFLSAPTPQSRMAALPAWDYARESLTLDALSSELLVLIFEQLADIDMRELHSVRATCLRFNAIATPIRYRLINLDEDIMSQDGSRRCPGALRNMRDLTKHLIIPSNLDHEVISRAVGLTRNLQTISWRCVATDASRLLTLPHHVLDSNDLKARRIQLRIENIPVQSLRSSQFAESLQGTPVSFIKSLIMARPITPMANRMETLKQLVLRSSNLQHFEYHDRGQGIQFDLKPGERLPPFRELVLRHYDWQHNATQTAEHWDLSQLRRLELISVPLFPFLSAISFSDLRNLHTLVAEDFSAHLSTDRRSHHTRGLHRLIRDSIAPDGLRKLQTTVHTALFPIDALLRHARSLEHLCLRDHEGLEDETRACPSLRIIDLQTLARRLTSLRYLEIDMDATSVAADTSAGISATSGHTRRRLFLDTLAAFPRVHTLTLHVQTLVRPHDPADPRREDRDYDATTAVFEMLRRARERIGGPAWRKVTINVGGWRPVMVRRLGQAWRRHNERGVFAERCFVIERASEDSLDSRAGAYIVREERAELRSRVMDSDDDEEEDDVSDDEMDEDEDEESDDNDYDDDDDQDIDMGI